MDLSLFAAKRKALDRQRKASAREATDKRETALVRQILQDSPASSREIASRMGVTTEQARRRVRQIGAVRDESGRWGI